MKLSLLLILHFHRYLYSTSSQIFFAGSTNGKIITLEFLFILMFIISLAVVALQRKCFVKESNVLYQSSVSSPTPPRFSDLLVTSGTSSLLLVL